jgi:hypothetical protein
VDDLRIGDHQRGQRCVGFHHVPAADAVADAHRPAAVEGGRRTEGVGARIGARRQGDVGDVAGVRRRGRVDRGDQDLLDTGEGTRARRDGAPRRGVVVEVQEQADLLLDGLGSRRHEERKKSPHQEGATTETDRVSHVDDLLDSGRAPDHLFAEHRIPAGLTCPGPASSLPWHRGRARRRAGPAGREAPRTDWFGSRATLADVHGRHYLIDERS